jgi:hypothetical protein
MPPAWLGTAAMPFDGPEGIASMEYCQTPTSAAEFPAHAYAAPMNHVQYDRIPAPQRHTYHEQPGRLMTPLPGLDPLDGPVPRHGFHVEPMMRPGPPMPAAAPYDYAPAMLPDYLMAVELSQPMPGPPAFAPAGPPLLYHAPYQEPADAGCVPMAPFPLRGTFDVYFDDKDEAFDQQPMPGQVF